MRVYLDNAATTPMAPEVIEAMYAAMKNHFGNPSSTHSFGREAKGILETSRRTIAKALNCQPAEVIFTSGGTEADNLAIQHAVHHLGVKRIITSHLEHHAVGHTALAVAQQNGVQVEYVEVDKQGNVNLGHLKELLEKPVTTLVSLMHANNEIATLLPIQQVGELCQSYGAYFHSDTVQTMGHYAFDLQSLPIDFITCAAHKLHGPKGIGFLYANRRIKMHAQQFGGGQERGLRGGTENMVGIVGLAKAIELAYQDLENHQHTVQALKTYFIEALKKEIPEVKFHGNIDPENSLYTVLNVDFPRNEQGGMLLFSLDLKGVAASGGSACSSGAAKGSHVLEGIGADPMRPNVRFSFSRYTTQEEIDFALSQIKDIILVKA